MNRKQLQAGTDYAVNFSTFSRPPIIAEERATTKADRQQRMDRIVALLDANGYVAAERMHDLYTAGADYYRTGNNGWEGPNQIKLEFTVDALERLIDGGQRELTAAATELGA